MKAPGPAGGPLPLDLTPRVCRCFPSISHLVLKTVLLFKREGAYVYCWLIHADVWQKPTQYCKAIILQLQINNNVVLSDPSSAPVFRVLCKRANPGTGAGRLEFQKTMENPERTEATSLAGTQAGPHGEAPVPGLWFPA